MRKRTKSKNRILRRYKNLIFILAGLFILSAYPLKLASQNISANVSMDETLHVQQSINADKNYDLEVFDNINRTDDPFSEEIIKSIEEAQNSIYVAVYSFNLDNIRIALFQAALRGVDVHLVYNYEDRDDFESFLSYMISFFKIKYLGDTKHDLYYYHMHHKFMIVDPGTDNEVLFTGPWNWSYFQEDSDPNILLKIKDPEIIDSYFKEFKRLEEGKSGVEKFKDWDYLPWEKEITYPNGDKIEIWWSPGRLKNSVFNRIYELIDNAENTIDIGVTLISSKLITERLIEKAEEGVKVRIIVDINQIDKETSIIPLMKEKIAAENTPNIEIIEGGKKPDEITNIYAIFHYQNMIVDDKIVLTGTANWTSGGFTRNDENTLVFYSEETAKKFSEIFEKYLDYLETQNVD